MNEPSHSDEELLALLQPPSMPEEFDFESNVLTRDISDEDDGDQFLPGTAPPAPMAPMDTADSVDQTQPSITSSDPLNAAMNEFGRSQPELTNGQKKEDEDEIAYEPIKTPSRTPRSAKARTSTTRPSSRRKLASSKPRFKARDKARLASEDPEGIRKSKPKSEQEAEPVPEPEQEQVQELPKPPSLKFDIVIDCIPPQAAQEYKPISPGDEIYRVLERIPTGVPGETWLSVEFEDGHIDQVSLCP